MPTNSFQKCREYILIDNFLSNPANYRETNKQQTEANIYLLGSGNQAIYNAVGNETEIQY